MLYLLSRAVSGDSAEAVQAKAASAMVGTALNDDDRAFIEQCCLEVAARAEPGLAPRLAVWGLVASSSFFNWTHAPRHPAAPEAFGLMPVIAALLFEFCLREMRLRTADRADRTLGALRWLRPAERFRGAVPEPRANVKSGRMPGSLNLPFVEIVEHGSLKAPDALKAVFAEHKIDLERPIITTCGSGVTAAILALVGVINLPVIKFSVDWWNTLHQPASVARMGGPTIDPSILIPLLVMAGALLLLYVTLVLLRTDTEIDRRRLEIAALETTEPMS